MSQNPNLKTGLPDENPKKKLFSIKILNLLYLKQKNFSKKKLLNQKKPFFFSETSGSSV
jgi:hypothetical protein